MDKSRRSQVTRDTKETQINATLNIDGSGKYQIETGIGFFNHMLEGFAKHGLFDLTLTANGDLNVDSHHTVEDCGIVLGTLIKNAIGDKKGINRYGYFVLPMDECNVICSIDLGGRPYYKSNCVFSNKKVGYMDTCLVDEFFYAVSYSAMMNIHFNMLSGGNDHHLIEAMFKAFAKALDSATKYDIRITDVLSTKGTI